MNPILSFRWGEAQEWLLSLHLGVKVHIAQVLLAVLGNCDYNTKALVLLFGRNLAEVTDNRPTMRQAFLNYLHNELFSRLAPFFTTPSEIAVLVEFFIRLYKIDPQRTRRSLLEGGLLPRIEAAIGNKYVAIAAVKLLRNFLEGSEAVFSYLRRHEHFKFLQERYQEVRGGVGRGVLHSLFSNLLREAGRSDNKAGAKFIHDLITA